jgi:EAL domain-containing protein (putative c-di-GMP-specific phosphodiesterase class I)
MNLAKAQKRPLFDIAADMATPLAVAASAADRETLDMVRFALANRRMRLAFQPVVYSADPAIIGYYKAYIRLLDPQNRVIPAGAFMGVAETQQLGREIDVASLQLGLHTLQRNPGIRIAISMSARSVGYKPWAQSLRAALKSYPGIGRGLILEIGEASAMLMPDVLIPFMDELRAEEIAFTLDDFGAGATSLQLLEDMEFDIAKIDGQFVRGIDRTPRSQAIVRAAVALAREFAMFPVAEAVETAAEATWLRDAGVGCLQGYLFGAPEVTPDFSLFSRDRPA